MKKNDKIYIILCIVLVLIFSLYLGRSKIIEAWRNYNLEPVPEAVNFEQINPKNENINNENININQNANINKTANSNTNIEIEKEVEILDSVNLDIPFQSQAPKGDWGHPYQEACEEASIILSVNYLRGGAALSKDEMTEKILALVDWQNKNWGGHFDLTAERTVELIENFYANEFTAELVYDFEWDDVKKALSGGYPVIAPTAGRLLGNPYYTAPGPLYHMLVIKGYTAKVMITNDVGTRRGANYQYSYNTLYNGIHDWNDGDVNNGRKVIIILKPL